MTRLFSQLAKPLAIIVACAALNVPATTASPIVLSFGNNRSGQAGLGTTSVNTLVATPIDASNLGGRKITRVAAGEFHSLLLTEDGNVFSCGANVYGQTGLGTSSGDTLAATPIDASNLGGRKITQVAAGLYHSLLLADDGSVFSFGPNDNGRTGLGLSGGITLVAAPIDASMLGGRKITQVSAGGAHSLLLAADGSVFSVGSNVFRQSGQGTYSDGLVAAPINASNLGGRAITQVAAGGNHSLLLADDGSVFSFGWNFYGQAGWGSLVHDVGVATPIDASNLGGRKITQVAAGFVHSLLLAVDGSVFSFGSNQHGQTGLGVGSGDTLVATLIDSSNLGGRKITEVAAGSAHSLLLAEDGAVFSFGFNYEGATGLGTTAGDTLAPTPIDASNLGGMTITRLSTGGHSLVIALVPEPVSFALAGLALLGLVGQRRRWR